MSGFLRRSIVLQGQRRCTDGSGRVLFIIRGGFGGANSCSRSFFLELVAEFCEIRVKLYFSPTRWRSSSDANWLRQCDLSGSACRGISLDSRFRLDSV